MTDRPDVSTSSVDPDDLERYDRLGDAWWDEAGPMGKLHEINPVRIGYIRGLVERSSPAGSVTEEAPLAGLRVLDIGCGGGVLAEPLARLGATVTGIDPAPGNIAVARRHAAEAGLVIEYRATTVEALAGAGVRFDVVIASEVVEHVVDRDSFVATTCLLVEAGGLLILSTLNRTAKAFLLAIVGAEYVLGWLPRGTHRWSQFVTPSELAAPIRRAGLKPLPPRGMIYDPLRRDWRLGPDTDVNYFLAAERPAA